MLIINPATINAFIIVLDHHSSIRNNQYVTRNDNAIPAKEMDFLKLTNGVDEVRDPARPRTTRRLIQINDLGTGILPVSAKAPTSKKNNNTRKISESDMMPIN